MQKVTAVVVYGWMCLIGKMVSRMPISIHIHTKAGIGVVITIVGGTVRPSVASASHINSRISFQI